MEQKRQQLLSAYLRERPQTTQDAVPRIAQRAAGAIAPLSLMQEELWRREMQAPDIAPLYNECIKLRMTGPLDLEALTRSFNEIVRRHAIWRTTFETRTGQPVQVIQPAAPLALRVIDLCEFSENEREAQAITLISDDARRRFVLEDAPPLRPTLLRMGQDEYWFFLVVHLMLLDGVSAYQIFPSELAVLYKAYAAGKSSPLPELPIQYADFACWQRETGEKAITKQIVYWRRQLEGRLPASAWPCGSQRAARKTYRGAIRPFEFTASLSESLKGFAKQENSTLFLVLLAGFAALIRQHTKHEEIVLGTLVSSGRTQGETLNLLGYFLNPVALRFSFESDPSFRELLAQSRMVLSDAILHGDVPIERLAKELEHSPSSTPHSLFSATVSLQPPMPRLDVNWSVTTMDVDSGGSPWDLYVAFVDRPQHIMGRVQFDPDLLDTQEITGTIADLQALLQEFTLNPARPVSETHIS
jgi:Condensation domain